MKLEAGKKYVTRAGDIVGPLRRDNEYHYPFFDEDDNSWMEDGVSFEGTTSLMDILSEYIEPVPNPSFPMSTQVGGSNYTDMAIQPMEYSMRNNLNACQHTAIKYVSRYKTKGGKEDLEKAIHTIQMLIAMEYPEATASTSE